MSAVTTHVLDTSLGRPAAGIPVRLEIAAGEGGWKSLGEKTTDADGRVRDLLTLDHTFTAGRYRITFTVEEYFSRRSVTGFYPEVSVVFDISDPAQHYHVPLLLSPFGYSTYRGS